MALWWEQWLTASAQEKDRMAPPFWIVESSAALFSECQLGPNDLAGAGPRVPMGRIEARRVPNPGYVRVFVRASTNRSHV